MTLAGGGALTPVALELPSAWYSRLRSAPRLSRHMEIRVCVSCCAVRPGGSRKWPQSVFLDAQGAGMSLAELDPDAHATTVAAGWDPNYAEPPSAVRYEYELAPEPLDSTVTLLVKPWMVAGWSTVPVDPSDSSSPRPQIRMTFRGDWSWGASVVALRAQVWERVALPADTFNPSRDPEHRCVIDGVSVGCTPAQHYEYVPLDDNNIARADRLAAAAAPFALSSPTGRIGFAAMDDERRERNQMTPGGADKRRPMSLQSPAAYRAAPIISPRDVVTSDRDSNDPRTDAEVHAETRRRLALDAALTSPNKPPSSTRKASARQRGIADSSSPYDSSPAGSPSASPAGVGSSYFGNGVLMSPGPAATEQVAIRVSPSPLAAVSASPRWTEPPSQHPHPTPFSAPRVRLAPLVIHTGESAAPTPQAAATVHRRPTGLPSSDPFHAHYAPEVSHFAATPAVSQRVASLAASPYAVQPVSLAQSPMALHDDLRASSLIRQQQPLLAQPNFIPTPTPGGQRPFREGYGN